MTEPSWTAYAKMQSHPLDEPATRKLAGDNAQYSKQNMSSPSPVTDGKYVWAMTGTGILTALNMNGEFKWKQDIQKDYGKFGLLWGYASSPLLLKDKLVSKSTLDKILKKKEDLLIY